MFFFMIFFFVVLFLFFFFNDTATTEIYTLSLHDALPISPTAAFAWRGWWLPPCWSPRSEEHTSELQSHVNLVCRLLLEKKKNKISPAVLKKNKKLHNTPQNVRNNV